LQFFDGFLVFSIAIAKYIQDTRNIPWDIGAFKDRGPAGSGLERSKLLFADYEHHCTPQQCTNPLNGQSNWCSPDMGVDTKVEIPLRMFFRYHPDSAIKERFLILPQANSELFLSYVYHLDCSSDNGVLS
jgi:hypothetical protein